MDELSVIQKSDNMNKPTLCVSNTVSDDIIHKCFGLMFKEEGNNPVESIELSGENMLVHIRDDIYNASIESPDDFYQFFEGREFLTMGLYATGDWVIGMPHEFEEYFRVWLIQA